MVVVVGTLEDRRQRMEENGTKQEKNLRSQPSENQLVHQEIVPSQEPRAKTKSM